MELEKISKEKIYAKPKEVSRTSKNILTNTKSLKGITLIALVVTIIVLLILAGVSINMALGNNGIFEKAKDAQNKMNEAVQNDMEGINYLNDLLNEYTNGTGTTGGTTPDTPTPEEPTPTLPTTTETTPYFPNTSFTQVSGTTLDTGLVVQDNIGNQYVWVEVSKSLYNNQSYNTQTTTEDKKPASSTDYDKIEYCLQKYTDYYRRDKNGTLTGYTDTYYSDDATGLTSTQYTQLKQKMLKSVYENGGFWVARYEAGISENRTASGEATVAPVSKADAYPCNWVTCSQAQTLANMLTTEDYTSSLMFGVQWDLVLKFIETKEVAKGTALATIQNALRSDSKNLGNYSNNLYTINSTTAKYSTNNGSTYTSTPYTKSSNSGVLLTTGASDSFSKMNISDLAGNVYEWTLEYTALTSDPCAFRGGNSDGAASDSPASCRKYRNTSFSNGGLGFRFALYK